MRTSLLSAAICLLSIGLLSLTACAQFGSEILGPLDVEDAACPGTPVQVMLGVQALNNKIYVTGTAAGFLPQSCPPGTSGVPSNVNQVWEFDCIGGALTLTNQFPQILGPQASSNPFGLWGFRDGATDGQYLFWGSEDGVTIIDTSGNMVGTGPAVIIAGAGLVPLNSKDRKSVV